MTSIRISSYSLLIQNVNSSKLEMSKKESKRPIVLAKKDDSGLDRNDKPKILLKAKENATPPVQISIAARPVDQNADIDKTNSQKAITNTKSIVAKDNKESQCTEPIRSQLSTKMVRPLQLISDHYQIVTPTFDKLIETNTDFYVVGAIGTQGSGKSTILNWLIGNSSTDDLLDGGTFKTHRGKEFQFSNMPSTEGIQMFVTPDRTIFLDCSPVLCNPYKKYGTLNELDDIKMIIFMLNVCNFLIVVEDEGVNPNFVRLIRCAEHMKTDVNARVKFSPNIMIFRNKCSNEDFLAADMKRIEFMYREMLRGTKLKFSSSQYGSYDDTESSLNIFQFPFIDESGENCFSAHSNVEILLAELRRRVFMAPRHPWPMQNQMPCAFNELAWSRLALSIWDSHKHSYFLRKYETLKEKEWSSL